MNSPIPHLPLFFSMFFAIYFTAHFIVFRNWSSKLRPEASSCLISLAHGTPAVLLACQAIISDATHGFASTNTDFQNSVLEYSIAYFLMDLCHYLIFNPSDVLFIGHHLATLFVFVTCRYLVVHGAYGILILLILAEVTSFFQNVWTLARALRAEYKVAAQVFDVLSPPFYALYSVVRETISSGKLQQWQWHITIFAFLPFWNYRQFHSSLWSHKDKMKICRQDGGKNELKEELEFLQDIVCGVPEGRDCCSQRDYIYGIETGEMGEHAIG